MRYKFKVLESLNLCSSGCLCQLLVAEGTDDWVVPKKPSESALTSGKELRLAVCDRPTPARDDSSRDHFCRHVRARSHLESCAV